MNDPTYNVLVKIAQALEEIAEHLEVISNERYGATPDLVGLSGVHIECKRNERLNVPEAMAQAARDADRFRDGAPAVFHRRNRSGWLVTMRLSDWIELYKTAAT